VNLSLPRDVTPGVRLTAWRIVEFTFKALEEQDKGGFDVYPEIRVSKNPQGQHEGRLTLTMNFFGEGQQGFAVHLVAEGTFVGEGLEAEKFATVCRTQGAALLVHPLRQFVQEFLSRVYS
jgi:preprotein translocase subunit SecB